MNLHACVQERNKKMRLGGFSVERKRKTTLKNVFLHYIYMMILCMPSYTFQKLPSFCSMYEIWKYLHLVVENKRKLPGWYKDLYIWIHRYITCKYLLYEQLIILVLISKNPPLPCVTESLYSLFALCSSFFLLIAFMTYFQFSFLFIFLSIRDCGASDYFPKAR